MGRRRVALVGAGLWLFGAMLLGGPLAAEASAQQVRPVDTYCSPTGDYCTQILRKGSRFYFELDTFAHRGAARFCVKPIGGRKRCKRRQLREGRNGVYVARINWNRSFPSRSKKRRKVGIFAGREKLGRTLTFKPV